MSTPTLAGGGRPGSGRTYTRAFLVGAVGGFVGYLLGELVNNDSETGSSPASLIFEVGLWSALIGLGLGLVLLAYDNRQSLRGRWHRDLARAAPLFAGFGFVAGAVAQAYYQGGEQNSLTRGIGWALLGAGLGLALGALRRDRIQALRGAVGGAVGGFVGGLIFNSLSLFSTGSASFSRAVGLTITGAMIAVFMRVVQEALKGAWLAGITTGPYEGKEYGLSKARVTVGRSDANDIGLYRETDLPLTAGALVFEHGRWVWQGQPVEVNGLPGTGQTLKPGDTIRFGRTEFLFEQRGAQAEAAPVNATEERVIVPGSVVAPDRWVLAGTDSARLFELPPGRVRVGRSSDNELVVEDSTVSGRHAELVPGHTSVVVRDLGSTNGTFLNGARLATDVPTVCQAGDALRFGTLEYRLLRS